MIGSRAWPNLHYLEPLYLIQSAGELDTKLSFVLRLLYAHHESSLASIGFVIGGMGGMGGLISAAETGGEGGEFLFMVQVG